jgi:LDH2 family malate/lactate/ureidoglycolate dehydrogenase
MTFDCVSTAISGIKVALTRARNRPLPPGCIIHNDDNPTTHASGFFAGAPTSASGATNAAPA